MIHDLTRFQGLPRRLVAAGAAVFGLALLASGQETLVANSPFAPRGSASLGAASAPAEAYELAGSTVEGSEVSVCIFERQAKHTRWIPVGGDVDGIKVVSFDPLNDTAVVVVAGARKELSMRKALVAATPSPPAGRGPQAPAPRPAPPIAAARPEAVGSQAQEQREARMLVSDLLEIGIQQRKAYQEAKRKAASGTPPPADN